MELQPGITSVPLDILGKTVSFGKMSTNFEMEGNYSNSKTRNYFIFCVKSYAVIFYVSEVLVLSATDI